MAPEIGRFEAAVNGGEITRTIRLPGELASSSGSMMKANRLTVNNRSGPDLVRVETCTIYNER